MSDTQLRILRDGTTPTDPRLDRIVQFDERSKQYGVAQLELTPGLRSVSYRLPRNLFLNQHREGACVGAGIGHDLAARPIPIRNVTMDWARENIYYPAQRRDAFAGGEYPGAEPHVGGTSVLDGVIVARDLGAYDAFHWGFSIDEDLHALCSIGPGIIGIAYLNSMFEPRPSGLLEVDFTSGVAGGHCLLVRGLRLHPKLRGEGPNQEPVVELPQSWGADFGDRGQVYMRVTDLERLLLDHQGEWCVPTGRHNIRIPLA